MSRRAIEYFQQRHNLSTAALVSVSSVKTRKELRAWCYQWLGVDAWRAFLDAERQARKRRRDKGKVTRVIVTAETHKRLMAIAKRSNSTLDKTIDQLLARTP